MRRRSFLALAGATAAAWPMHALVTAQTKLWRIAIVSLSYTDDRLQVLGDALAGAGYVDGKTAIINFFIAQTTAETDAKVDAALATKPDVIITFASPAPLALQARHVTVPVVMTAISDPVAVGLAQSYAHPGGNFTGSMQNNPELVAKVLQILREIVRTVRKVTFFADQTDQAYGPSADQAKQAEQTLGIDVTEENIVPGQDYQATIDRIAKAGAEAIYAFTTPVFNDAVRFVPIATQHKLPVVGYNVTAARMGILIGYGANTNAVVRNSVPYVDAVLKGANPANLPIIQASVFDFVVNLKTAKALGITIPPSVLLQATEIIQ